MSVCSKERGSCRTEEDSSGCFLWLAFWGGALPPKARQQTAGAFLCLKGSCWEIWGSAGKQLLPAVAWECLPRGRWAGFRKACFPGAGAVPGALPYSSALLSAASLAIAWALLPVTGYFALLAVTITLFFPSFTFDWFVWLWGIWGG